MRKGQISIEMIFGVGIILLMFLVILSLSFVKKQEAIKTEQMVEARAECVMLADALSSVRTLGPTANFSLKLYYKQTVQNTSIIYSFVNDSSGHIAFCNYLGAVGPYVNLSGLVRVQNLAGNITITPQ